MNNLRIHQIYITVLFLVVAACTESDQDFVETAFEIPSQLQNVNNLRLIAPAEGSIPDSITLSREVVYESNDDVFIEGYINDLTVDDQGRVYIAATVPGNVGVYVFNSDGTFIQRFANEGRGPGEYESIVSLQIEHDTIKLFDSRLQKIGRFSTTDFSHIDDILLKKDELTPVDTLANSLRGSGLHAVNESDDILHLRKIAGETSDIQTEAFYRVTDDAVILPGSILTLDRFQFYYPPKSDRLELPVTMPFTRSSLFSVTNDGRLITNWTEDFLIRIYDVSGNMERALYLPVTNSTLDMKEFDLNRFRERTLAQYDMPDTWPAVHTMELDDRDRIWIATITNSDSSFKWHVINLEGELLAKFEQDGDRMSRQVMSKPFYLIKDGYFFSHERDLRQDIDRIVKHRIEFVRR